jgi:queuine tRNA-ribosyltransferase
MDIIRQAGGLHRFMNWSGPILTDSGGFQVFSLGKIRKIRDHGVEFRSHLDGSPIFLGPKESMEIQRTLGSDIAKVFDECPPHTADRDEVNRAVKRTLRWAAECKAQPRAEGQLVFGIVQGTHHADFRKKCAEALVEMDFDGYAIGGVSVGEPEPEMMHAVEISEPHLPENKARYAMGLGTPAQLIELVPVASRTAVAGAPFIIRVAGAELEVLRLVVTGQTSQDISERLSISKTTVDTHRHHILEKLNCRNSVDLTRMAIALGLV